MNKEEIIELMPYTPRSKLGKQIGFDKFEDYSWITRVGNIVYISMISSPRENIGKGYFSKLVKNIQALGYEVRVPTPSHMMLRVLYHWKAEAIQEYDKTYGGTIETYRIPALNK